MKRKDYWISVLTMFALTFFLGFIGGMVIRLDEWLDQYVLLVQLGAIIWMWYIGAARMKDTGHSQWWAIFAPSVLGMIVIGCLASKEHSNDL